MKDYLNPKPTLLGNLASIVVSSKDILVAGTTKLAVELEKQNAKVQEKAQAKSEDTSS